MTSLRSLAPLLLLAAPATAQVTIDSRGIRTGGTTIDAKGIHAHGNSIDATGIHRGSGGRVIDDNHLTQRIDCAGGTLTVNGNHNNLTLANCRTVTVAGNHNMIDASFAAPGQLEVVGNFDQVTYSAAPRVSVSVNNVGTRSSVTRR